MKIEITLRQNTVIAKRTLFYFETSKGEHYKQRVIFWIGRFQIFDGEFGRY